MDVWQAVRTKRMVRRFEDRRLEPEHVERILDAGRHAGSSKNLQRWDFVVVEDRERQRELGAVGENAGHLAGASAAVALVIPDPHAPDAPLSIVFDLGVAAQNMMLVAWELGIGSCPATIYEHDAAREMLGHPADWHCEYLISFGYPANEALLTARKRAGKRRALAEIVHRERW